MKFNPRNRCTACGKYCKLDETYTFMKHSLCCGRPASFITWNFDKTTKTAIQLLVKSRM